MNFYEQAAEKLKTGFDKVKGVKAAAMKTAVRDALLSFAEQEEEFAQAIAQGGSFPDCMTAVANGVGQSISDLEAFERATRFYFPGARVRFEMHVDLIGDAGTAEAGTPPQSLRGSSPGGGAKGLVFDLADFL